VRLDPWYKDKVGAASIMDSAVKLIQERVQNLRIETDLRFDPNSTGLVGPQETLITTDKGLLESKLIATQPNFAAVVVDLLKKAGVQKGDVVAASFTGSMPGANIAVMSACEALGIKLILISSVGASSWGATNPEFTWLDMEAYLVKKGVFSRGSVAASMGGSGDQARSNPDEGRKVILEAIRRNGLELIQEDDVDASADRRMQIYDRQSEGTPIRAFINVGGGAASLGTVSNGDLFVPGLNKDIDVSRFYRRGVMVAMAERQIPIIHLLHMQKLAGQYGLPLFPVPLPEVGVGKVFADEKYKLGPILMTLVAIVTAMVICIETDLHLLPKLFARRSLRNKRRDQ
jgi:poly-gamma-glutamate system protein